MKINVTFPNNETLAFDQGVLINQVAEYYQSFMTNPILGCRINNEIVPMNYPLTHDCHVEFLDVTDRDGYKMYQAGLKYIFEVALKEAFGNDVKVSYEHSVAKGLIANVSGVDITNDYMSLLKNRMANIISADLPFTRYEINAIDAINFFNKINQPEKAKNIRNINTSVITLYKLKNNLNYYYSKMPYSTKSISKFDIKNLGGNQIVLLFPTATTKGSVPEYVHYEKVIKCFNDNKNWLKLLNVPYAADINSIIAKLKIEDFIRTCEMNFNNQICRITDDIITNGDIKYIMIAGPSSSGKTTTTKKIALALESKGLRPVVISIDDYFIDYDKAPIDPETNRPDTESIRGINIEQLNADLKALMEGKEVILPRYNFVTQKSEFYNHSTILTENSIILIEGLHALNNMLTPDIDPKDMYHIYLSPFIPLNIDCHNYISTLDLRFLRRLSRDVRSRNRSIDEIFESWHDVRAGEEKNIFPYIHQADIVINTALPYETGVLKVMCEPLLLSVDVTSKNYEEAQRLLDFLKIFYCINNEYVPNDSVLREFIGGSIFE